MIKDADMNDSRCKTAVVPGSFDPMTAGHKEVIKAASEMFDRVIVAIMVNPDKVDTAFFSFEQRKKIAELTCADILNVEVVISFGMLWEFARSNGALAIVKGIRNCDDLEYEKKMAEYNHGKYPGAHTVYIPTYGDMANISSTVVRNSLCHGEIRNDLLDHGAIEYIKSILDEK